ncbi:MAG: SiaC family regulatory phosphoprotein [Bacteroidales bacterium]|nr:SiaC family regulatory phosphoprotein [Bacteroidales bacterium]
MAFQYNIFSKFIASNKEADNLSPKLELLRRMKKVRLSGVSRMADPSVFYNNLVGDLENYYFEFNKTLFLEFHLDYINTGSVKWIHFLLGYLEDLHKDKGGIIEVTWRYESDDESIEETGEVLKSKLSLPFILKPVA